jgi:Xaa-Pro dipeptidase
VSRAERRERVHELLERRGLRAVVLGRPANFAWYTGGADNRVDHADPGGVAAVLVGRGGEWVVTSAVEAARMRSEQTPDIEVAEYPWHKGPGALLAELAGGALGADAPVAGAADVSEELAALRRTLGADELARYREVGRDAVAALAETAAELEPGMGEQEAAARLDAACRRRGLNAPVLMAAGAERTARYRHPIPRRGARLGERAMLVACAERGGLYANLTRFRHFEEPSAELARRLAACEAILVGARAATRPGRTLGDVFDAIVALYAEHDFPDEWRLHHQGGLTGYASREIVVTPGAEHRIQPSQAFAWNPSITGAKAEETFVLGPDGPEILTIGGEP